VPRRRCGARPHRRDVRAGLVLAETVPRRTRRLGGPVAVRDRAQRARRIRPARPARAGGTRAARRRARASPCRGRARRDLARRARRGARRASGRPGERDRAPCPRRTGLRRGRPGPRDDGRGGPRPRASRPHDPTTTPEGGTMTQLTPRLTALGDALERASRADLARHPVRRRLALAAAALAILVPGAAIATIKLTEADEVAAGMPAGTLALAGREPRCTVVTSGVEYRCVLTRPPAPEVSDWKGTVEPTVDATKHVNGGCRGLSSDGLEWECLPRPGRRRPGHHRSGLPRGVRAVAGRRLIRPARSAFPDGVPFGSGLCTRGQAPGPVRNRGAQPAAVLALRLTARPFVRSGHVLGPGPSSCPKRPSFWARPCPFGRCPGERGLPRSPPASVRSAAEGRRPGRSSSTR